MQPQSRGTAVLQLAKSHFRALLEGERSVKNRSNAFLQDRGESGGRSPEPPGPSEMHYCAILVASTQKISLAAELRSHGSVAAFLQLRTPSNERCDAAHFHSGWLCTAFRGVWGVL